MENESIVDDCARELTDEEKLKLMKDSNFVSEFKQLKLEKEAQKNWDLFYKRNTTNFFKDRHWTTREFEELCGDTSQTPTDRKILLEVGCGVGNFLFPLLKENTNIFIYACDFSLRAVNFVKENQLYDEKRCFAFNCDITKQELDEFVKEPVDFVSLVFVLSALHPDTFIQALKNIYKVLRPGGTLLFRDYGIYDAAMLRFKPGHKLMENFYVRQDGTRAYYFSKEMVNRVFTESGFVVETNNYVHRRTVNLKEDDFQVMCLVSSSHAISKNYFTIFRFSDEVQILSLDSSSQAISKFSDYCIFRFMSVNEDDADV
ncbi:Methyltransferase-like protein 6 [Chamberlinius hualienensis]